MNGSAGSVSFQFHKGAIRTIFALEISYLLFHFNSIKVRLERARVSPELDIVVEFQFHKGAIRTSGETLAQGISSAFQFHKGAIRTDYSNQMLIINPEFQFHKGAIRTHNQNQRAANYHHFNSIKVRLEQALGASRLSANNNFNSIKVRLEPVTTETIGDRIKFQFHKGAIRTGLRKMPTVG